MKKIIVLLLFLLIGCNNNSIKSNKITVEERPLIIEIDDKDSEKTFSNTSKKSLVEKINNNSIIVEKMNKKKFLRKKVIEAPYTEYIFK
ncbi:hypothetical protein LH398_04385 [Fusobacterium nucleatum]|uniref:Lipoprotein n=2 Tax=Fusobacterium TaxID=848 RepID=H1HCM1_9FUSO|nr:MULTISPECIES: hypothetical protein [Fusobacterium]EHO79219.1 hypothetical protein HMPREF9942_00222 [Fusobacterium animalis F0419]KXA26138.1 hypothetical protein HMPREF3221_00140 [Fusobacterium nucleatum]MCL4575727.1 hypothetical protein [Fusobacterium nucleatum YWH7056]MCL4582227.1 hypothetical protein [Fusobacterium nucleatum YWH7054]CDA09037.1 uncharacterized protein BN748_00861 [Fusobacterium sp. CAG:649]